MSMLLSYALSPARRVHRLVFLELGASAQLQQRLSVREAGARDAVRRLHGEQDRGLDVAVFRRQLRQVPRTDFTGTAPHHQPGRRDAADWTQAVHSDAFLLEL